LEIKGSSEELKIKSFIMFLQVPVVIELQTITKNFIRTRFITIVGRKAI
jgi:hypothetical protein